jgi:hypothetical protein
VSLSGACQNRVVYLDSPQVHRRTEPLGLRRGLVPGDLVPPVTPRNAHWGRPHGVGAGKCVKSLFRESSVVYSPRNPCIGAHGERVWAPGPVSYLVDSGGNSPAAFISALRSGKRRPRLPQGVDSPDASPRRRPSSAAERGHGWVGILNSFWQNDFATPAGEATQLSNGAGG